VTDFGPSLQLLVDGLVELLAETKALGLSATQVDDHRQVVVVDPSGTGLEPRVFVNPTIEARVGQCMVEEGCLSVPGVVESVKRALKVRVSAQDRHGADFEVLAEELLAVCLQHEIDHLHGMLFIDRLSFMRRQRAKMLSERASRQRASARAAAQ
jgi:peptide deformylase